MLFYDRCDFLLPLQRYYWLQRNNLQKVPNNLQKLEQLIYLSPHVITLEHGTTFFFEHKSPWILLCETEDEICPRVSRFFSSSVLPLDTLNTHCVNLISKEATICLLTTIHCDLNAPVALKIGPQKETQQLCPADYLWTTLLMMSRLRSSSIL